MRVNKKWIDAYVETLYGFGGQISKEDVVRRGEILRPKKGFETTLTEFGINNVEQGLYKGKFHILLPNGLGWCDCFGY